MSTDKQGKREQAQAQAPRPQQQQRRKLTGPELFLLALEAEAVPFDSIDLDALFDKR